jgi:hypothetical protein
LNFIAEALGIDRQRITVISDDSEGTRLLASTHGWAHFLCQWHYVSNYIRVVKQKGVKHAAAAQYHEIFYRLLTGTDFDSRDDFDQQLTDFVDSFKSEYDGMTSWLNRFVADKEMVCEFFRYGTFTAGTHTTQRNESMHSLLKMGNLLANALREMSFYEAYTYIKDVVDTMLESSLDELAECIAKKMHCSHHVLCLLKEANLQCVDLCMNEDGWAIQTQSSLPSTIQRSFHPSATFFKVLSTHHHHHHHHLVYHHHLHTTITTITITWYTTITTITITWYTTTTCIPPSPPSPSPGIPSSPSPSPGKIQCDPCSSAARSA